MAVVWCVCGGRVAFSASTTRYQSLSVNGSVDPVSTEAHAQLTYRKAGTLSHLSVVVTSNGTTASSTIRVRKNGANGNQVITITSGQTGEFEDASGTDSVASTDEVNYSIVTGAGGSLTITGLGAHFSADSDTAQYAGTCGIWSTNAGGTTSFHAFGGDIGGAMTTDANAEARFPFAATAENLFVYVSANARSNNTTFSLRINSVNSGNLSVPVPGGGTGIFEDATGSDSIVVDNEVCFRMTTGSGSTNSITVTQIQCSLTNTTGNGFAAASHYVSGVAVSVGTTRYVVPQGFLEVNTTESDVRQRPFGAIDATAARVYVGAYSISGGSATVTLRKSSADTLLEMAVTGTGWVSDTDTVSFSATDTVTWELTATGSSGSFAIRNAIWATAIPAPPGASKNYYSGGWANAQRLTRGFGWVHAPH